MEDASLSLTDLEGLLSEGLLGDEDIDDRNSSDLEQICAYNFISRDDVWVADDEETVESLLLKEIDVLPLPAITASNLPPYTHTPSPNKHPLVSSSISSVDPPTDCPPLHTLPWPWGWEDPLTPSPITTLPLCDGPDENFDLLAYTAESSLDSLLPPHPDSLSSRTEQLTKSGERSLHHHILQEEELAEFEPVQHSKLPGKQRLLQPSCFADQATKSEKSGSGLPELGTGEKFRHSYTAKTSRECQGYEFLATWTTVPESEKSPNLDYLKESCKPFPELETASKAEASFRNGASEEELQFSQDEKQPLVASGTNRESETTENVSTYAGSWRPDVHKESKRYGNEPKRPQNGFIRYSVQHRAQMSRRHPYKDNRGISKLLGTCWKKMTREQKRPYEEEFNKDIHKIRTQHPMWRYAPVKKSAQDSVEPMANRLRPRDKIRSRYQDLDDTEWDWELPKNSGDFNRQADGSKSPLQHGATSWLQCDVCGLWRPLPGHVELEDLPETWSCMMNPDERFSVCGQVFSSLPVNGTSTRHLPHLPQRPKPLHPQVSEACHLVTGTPCASFSPSQPSLLIICSSLPSFCAPANSITHAILVSQSAAVAL